MVLADLDQAAVAARRKSDSLIEIEENMTRVMGGTLPEALTGENVSSE